MRPSLAQALIQSVNDDIDSPTHDYDAEFSASMVALGWITACALLKRDGVMSAEIVNKLSELAAECLADLERARRKLNEDTETSH